MVSFLLSALVDMGWLISFSQAGLLDWASWIFGMAGILFYFIAIREHRRSH